MLIKQILGTCTFFNEANLYKNVNWANKYCNNNDNKCQFHKQNKNNKNSQNN